MKIICAWRRKEGKPDVMGEKEPLDDSTETHGLCPEHRRECEEQLEALRKNVDP